MDEALTQFISITGADASEATHVLEATGADLDAAVQLYFESQQHDRGQEDASEALARQLMQESATTSRPLATDEGDAAEDDGGVRRADEARVERLYDVGYHEYGHAAGSIAGTRARVRDVPLSNFRGEEGVPGLSDMYQPPAALTSGLSLDECAAVALCAAECCEPKRDIWLKQMALQQDQWMLINVQDPGEFASLQLNADLWSVELLVDVIKGNFQFAQRTMPGHDAQQLKESYQLYSLPAIMVIDPNTGQKMHEWRGNPDADKFMEDLVPFMSTPPSDPSAGNLVTSTVRQSTFSRPVHVPSGAAGIAGVSDEEEALTKAIEASMSHAASMDVGVGDSGAGPSRAARAMSDAAAHRSGGAMPAHTIESSDEGDLVVGADEDDDEDVQVVDDGAAPTEASGDEIVAAALSRLRDPPGAGSSSCRVAFRLPDGRRVRAFHPDDCVSALYDFVLTELGPESATQQFELRHAAPGAPALPDRESTLQDAGLANSMLQLQWL